MIAVVRHSFAEAVRNAQSEIAQLEAKIVREKCNTVESTDRAKAMCRCVEDIKRHMRCLVPRYEGELNLLVESGLLEPASPDRGPGYDGTPWADVPAIVGDAALARGAYVSYWPWPGDED
jgi:hypothetical protein